jgi:hypothetical protein
MYGIYLWQNNTCYKIWKNCIYISKQVLRVEFLGEFFYGIWYWYAWIKSRTILDEIPFKKCVFFAFLNNKCIIKKIRKKTITISKRKRFYRWALHYFFSFFLFGNVLWTINMRPYGCWKTISYIFMYINFIQSSSSNHWIKINFDSK